MTDAKEHAVTSENDERYRHIWLLWSGNDYGWSWCDQPNPAGLDDAPDHIEYVRADLYHAQKAKARASALDARAASGQAQEAHEAQMKAEAERDKLRVALTTLSCCSSELRSFSHIEKVARAALKQEDKG